MPHRVKRHMRNQDCARGVLQLEYIADFLRKSEELVNERYSALYIVNTCTICYMIWYFRGFLQGMLLLDMNLIIVYYERFVFSCPLALMIIKKDR